MVQYHEEHVSDDRIRKNLVLRLTAIILLIILCKFERIYIIISKIELWKRKDKSSALRQRYHHVGISCLYTVLVYLYLNYNINIA